MREIDLAPAHVALGFRAIAHAFLAPERELRRRIAGEHAAKHASIGRANVSGSCVSFPSAVRSSSRNRSARCSDAVPTASTLSFNRNNAVVRSDFSSAFGSSSSRVCSFSLRFVRRPGSSCMRWRYSARRTSSASLTAAVGSTRV